MKKSEGVKGDAPQRCFGLDEECQNPVQCSRTRYLQRKVMNPGSLFSCHLTCQDLLVAECSGESRFIDSGHRPKSLMDLLDRQVSKVYMEAHEEESVCIGRYVLSPFSLRI